MRFYVKEYDPVGRYRRPEQGRGMPVSLTVITPLLLLLGGLSMGGCRQHAVGYGFTINKVSITRGYQVLDIHVEQELDLSQQAREALQNGVVLTFRLDLELSSDSHMIAIKRIARLFQIRYLPLSQRFQLTANGQKKLQSFSRLRYALAAIDALDVRLASGPLPTGGYQLRTRMRLDKSRLPAPMQLPAWFSPQWRHDSDWSVWPFKVNA